MHFEEEDTGVVLKAVIPQKKNSTSNPGPVASNRKPRSFLSFLLFIV